MRYVALIILSSLFIACAGDGAGGYDETEGSNQIDRTDTLNRESPYNTPGATDDSQPEEGY